ncbi:unnamed protein product [Effrenium voratum]|nr:unnamed protein product [Effrenium voratum]
MELPVPLTSSHAPLALFTRPKALRPESERPRRHAARLGWCGALLPVLAATKRRRGLGRGALPTASVLEDTLFQAYRSCLDSFSSSPSSAQWSVEEEDEIDDAVLYSRFRAENLPARQGRLVGNTLRRTLLRQDLFRTHAACAFRLRYRSFNVDQGKVFVSRAQAALHEFASVPGVQESMIDVVRNVQQLTVAPAPWRPPPLPLAAAAAARDVESWRWSARRCGPTVVTARDMDMVDSSSFYERPMCLPLGSQHLLTISAPAMVELEVEATCCSQKEWEISPAFEKYRQQLRFDRWLLVPPIFSPVKKVNYRITAGEDGQENLQLELWTSKSATPNGDGDALSEMLTGAYQDPNLLDSSNLDQLL